MTADLTIPLPRWPALEPAGTLRFVGRAAPEAVTALAVRMADECRAAVDADEVAALLEAAGINDRVAARDYGAPSVFALASMLLARVGEAPAVVVAPVEKAHGPTGRQIATDTLVRATLYLTPLAVGLGAASEVDGLNDLPVTGTLILGWGAGQALAYLGYRALSERGVVSAARLLAGGYAGLALLWTAVLGLAGTPWPRGYAVAGAQLAFFAAVGVALVTSRERRVLAWAAPAWLSAGALAMGVGGPALLALMASLAVLVGVAFRPALGLAGAARSAVPARGRWRSWPQDLAYAVRYGAVGTGQAVLLVSVALASITPGGVPLEAVPLLLGVPLIELTLVWHQRRVAAARAALDDRLEFDRRLGRVSAGTTAVLAVPVVIGGGIAFATWVGRHPPGGEPLAAAVLLVSVYALCLVLAAHRRAGTAAALVWWPAILVTLAGVWGPSLVSVAPRFTETLAAATLFGASVPGLAVAALVLRDPESYR